MKQLLCVCGACGPLPREALTWKRGGWPPCGGAGGDVPGRPSRQTCQALSSAACTRPGRGNLHLTSKVEQRAQGRRAGDAGAMPGGKGQATEKGKREPLLSVAGRAPGKPLPCPRRPAIPSVSMKSKSSETKGFLFLSCKSIGLFGAVL